MLDRVFVGQKVSRLDVRAPSAPVSRVTLVVDGESSYTAGDDSGRTIEKNLPWATQAMAESVLRCLQDVTYRPFFVKMLCWIRRRRSVTESPLEGCIQ